MAYLPAVPPLTDEAALRSLGLFMHVQRHGIKATARAVGVELETFTDWYKRYNRYAHDRLAIPFDSQR